MNTAEKLRELSENLYWAWHPEFVRVFRDINPELWRDVNHNPMLFLEQLADEVIKSKTADLRMVNRITQAFRQLQNYLGANEVWGAWYAGPLRARPVAYFSAEFGLHESLPIYSGGLGVLAGDHLKAAADLGVPLVGIGLAYAHGYFDQALDSEGWQQEHYYSAETALLPFERVKNENGEPIRIAVDTESYQIWVAVWRVLVGRNMLLLLDTNIDGNSEEDRELTSRLYGGDRRMRIRQELVLGVGGLRALGALGISPSVIHMNEGHSAFAVLELARNIMDRDGQPFDNVRGLAAAMTVFTTHTAVAAGHDVFEPQLVEQTLARLRRQLGLTKNELLALGRLDPTDPRETFSMTVLAFKMSHYHNAVSHLHARITKAIWKDLWPETPEHILPIDYITNGVHIDSWLSEPMAQLYNKCLGANWREAIDAPSTWDGIEEIDDIELWEKHQDLRADLVEYVNRTVRRQDRARTGQDDSEYAQKARLDPSALTIGVARRFAAYKRLDILFRDTARLERLLNRPGQKVQFIFAGKAHPQDEGGKSIIQKVFKISREPRFIGKIIFLENYDINVCRHLVQGADAWINTPRRPLEACGTSGQKAAMNGCLNISVLDGWWAQAYDGTNGFAVGAGSEHANLDHQDHLDAESLYSILENKVVPLFYDRGPDGIPHGWIARQKHALRTLTWRFSATRMVIDYTLGYYLRAAGGLTSSVARADHHRDQYRSLSHFAQSTWSQTRNL